MRSHLKPVLGIIALTATATSLLSADATTTYPAYTTNLYGTPTYPKSISVTASSPNNAFVALNAQALMLKEMLQEHQSRAADLTQKNEAEKAKWETELANELQEKSLRLRKRLDELAQSGLATNGLKAASLSLMINSFSSRQSRHAWNKSKRSWASPLDRRGPWPRS